VTRLGSTRVCATLQRSFGLAAEVRLLWPTTALVSGSGWPSRCRIRAGSSARDTGRAVSGYAALTPPWRVAIRASTAARNAAESGRYGANSSRSSSSVISAMSHEFVIVRSPAGRGAWRARLCRAACVAPGRGAPRPPSVSIRGARRASTATPFRPDGPRVVAATVGRCAASRSRSAFRWNAMPRSHAPAAPRSPASPANRARPIQASAKVSCATSSANRQSEHHEARRPTSGPRNSSSQRSKVASSREAGWLVGDSSTGTPLSQRWSDPHGFRWKRRPPPSSADRRGPTPRLRPCRDRLSQR